MLIPKPRGAFSEELFATMRGWPDEKPSVRTAPDDLEDAAIALWALYELHYRGFDDADDRLEWDPALLQVRRGLEEDLEAELYGTHDVMDAIDASAKVIRMYKIKSLMVLLPSGMFQYLTASSGILNPAPVRRRPWSTATRRRRRRPRRGWRTAAPGRRALRRRPSRSCRPGSAAPRRGGRARR